MIVLFTIDSLGQNLLDLCGWPPTLAKARDQGLYYPNAYTTTPSTHMACLYMLAGKILPHPWSRPKSFFAGFSQDANVKLVQQEMKSACLVPWRQHGKDMSHGFNKWYGEQFESPSGDQGLVPVMQQIKRFNYEFVWIHTFPLYGYAHGLAPRNMTAEEIKQGAQPLLKYADALLSCTFSVFSAAHFIISADHGDAFQGGSGHGFELAPEALRVPLVVWDRKRKPGVETRPVSTTIVADWVRRLSGTGPEPVPGAVRCRTFLPLQGGGEIGGVNEEGLVRIYLSGDRGSFERDPAPFEDKPSPQGVTYYPGYTPGLDALGNLLLDEERDIRLASLRMRK